jgi:cytochrome c biogenesis protein CcmG, thiol:disulfide interchange protein DsbE
MIFYSRRQISILGAALSLLAIGGTSPPAVAQSGALNLASYKGKVVYLDFWASWCGPCKQSFPYMQGLVQKYGAGGFVVLTVNLDRSRSQADAFLRKVGARLPVTYDSAGTLAKQYGVKDMPTSVLIDRQGRVRFTHKGFHPNEQGAYEAHIDQLIKER